MPTRTASPQLYFRSDQPPQWHFVACTNLKRPVHAKANPLSIQSQWQWSVFFSKKSDRKRSQSCRGVHCSWFQYKAILYYADLFCLSEPFQPFHEYLISTVVTQKSKCDLTQNKLQPFWLYMFPLFRSERFTVMFSSAAEFNIWSLSLVGFSFSLFSQPILVSSIGFSDEVHFTLKFSCRTPC